MPATILFDTETMLKRDDTTLLDEINAKPRKLAWRDGLPYSTEFQDVYFSSDNGLLETEYVFLQGNDLPARWQHPDLTQFTIIETGFGTGLNFL